MRATETRGHWAWAIGIAVAVLAGVLLLFRAPAPSAPPPPRVKPSVKLDASPALRNEAKIFDPAPLFLPTEQNAVPKPVARREPGAAFPDYSAKLEFADPTLKLDALELPSPVNVPTKPEKNPGDVLALPTPTALALGLNRSETPVPALSARGAVVEVFAAGTGRRVLPPTLAIGARPPGAAAWQPLEFLAAVDAAGLVGPLVLTARSGVDEVDSYFQNYLVRTLRVGERLAPGFYRISVGP